MKCHTHGILSFTIPKVQVHVSLDESLQSHMVHFQNEKKQIKYSSSLHNISCKQQLDAPGH